MASATFRLSFDIGGRLVGPGSPVFVIAEAGLSHFGDMALAEQLVDLAAEGGADESQPVGHRRLHRRSLVLRG